ncbi:alpha/beta fold hydrolase [Pseudarthrobacter sp. J1738]|uniref:alpha/beta fold hydrolase n=1 Tax=Pseudarthrobacter sp. J1738 TaxID=3420446 RepID=UPI003D2B71BA
MSGRHSGAEMRHTVEGTDPGLFVEVHRPEQVSALPPVLLIHGFASSARLNWQDTGWLNALLKAGRTVITVDLPGHGQSTAPEDMDSYAPSRIRADLLQIAYDAGARPVREGDASSGLDIIGYSFGARLAWELGATQRGLVRRMVLGGPARHDPLAAFDLRAAQQYLADGTPITDASTASLLKMAQLLPSNNIFALLTLVEAVKVEPFDPAEAAPSMPVLLIAGDQDERADTIPELISLLPGGTAQQVIIPGRTHFNAITSRMFKDAAIEFLAKD